MRTYFHTIYERYHRRVYVFVSKYVDATDEVEDIVQEIFVHLWKHVKALHRHEHPESIIFKASRQEVTNYYRRKKIDFTFLEEGYDIEDTTPFPSDQEDKNKRLSNIQSLIKVLPERRKTIFLQSVVDELSYSEIALKHKISKSAVAKQIAKALDFLKTNSSY